MGLPFDSLVDHWSRYGKIECPDYDASLLTPLTLLSFLSLTLTLLSLTLTLLSLTSPHFKPHWFFFPYFPFFPRSLV